MNLNLPQRKRLSAFFALSHFFRPLGYGWGTKQKKNPRNVDFPGISKRRSRDLNPGCGHPHYSLSRGAPSATWVLLQAGKRSERDSNPRYLSVSLVFKTSAFNRSAIAPGSTSEKYFITG